MEAGRRDSGAVRCASRRTGPRGRSRLDASAESRVVVFAVLLRVPVALDAQVAFRDAEGGMAGRTGIVRAQNTHLVRRGHPPPETRGRRGT